MKKKMKKLLAVLMAVAMLMSLSMTAFATGDDDEGGDDTEITTVYGAPNGAGLPYSGNTGGSSTSEGPLPDDPVEVILPTIPAAISTGDNTTAGEDDGGGDGEAAEASIFDIILDPHGLINETDAARYAEDGITKNFSEDSRLYFLKSWDTTTRNYDGESHALTITNKGRQPINVDLSLNFTYGEEGSDVKPFVLVDDKALLEAPANENDEAVRPDDAAMWLALKVGTGDDAIISPVTDPSIIPYGTAEGEVDAAEAAVAEAMTTPVIYVTGNGDYIAAPTSETVDDAVEVTPSISFEWGDDADTTVKEAIMENLDKLSVTVSYATPVDAVVVEDDPDTSDVDESESSTEAIPASFRLSGAFTNTYAFTTPDPVVAGDEGEDITGSISITGTGDNASKTYATISINFLAPNIRTMKVSNAEKNTDQVIKFKAPVAGTIVHTAIEALEGAYTKDWMDPNGTKASTTQGITTAGYYWKINESLADSAFPTLTFKLLGNINDDLLWDALDTQPGVTFELVWDIMQRRTVNGDGVIEFGNEEIVKLITPSDTGSKPTLTLSKKATNSAQLSLNVNLGVATEDYIGYTPKLDDNGKVIATLSNDNTLTMDYASGKLTAEGTVSTNFSNIPTGTSASITVTFAREGYEDVDVTFTGAMR